LIVLIVVVRYSLSGLIDKERYRAIKRSKYTIKAVYEGDDERGVQAGVCLVE
jgi:hypothetical protein